VRSTSDSHARGYPKPVSQDTTASDAARGEGAARGRYWWLRWVILGIAVVVLGIELALVWDQLARAWHSLYSAHWWWVLAAAGAALTSLHSFAQLVRTLLRSAGVKVKQWRAETAVYAGNALGTTLPGGPVLSATFMYRQQRIWGASPVVASWQLVMAGVLQMVGLALLGLGGAFLLGAKNNPFSLIFTLGGLLTLILLAQAVASRPELIDGIGVRVLTWINSARAKSPDNGLHKWRETLGQLEAVNLSRRELGVAFGWSMFNWLADMMCLLFATWAAGGHPSLAGVTVAYAAARAVGSIPLMPGGLLVVEAVLVPGLVTSGMTLPDAISAMLIYRLISWVFIAVIGWVIFFFLFRTESQIDPDAAERGGIDAEPEPEADD
jgi:putative heme transporter